MFNQRAIELLGYYVYGLFDPGEPAMPFYIGTGCGNRVHEHVRGASVRRSADDLMALANDRIDRIGRDQVVAKILRFALSETEALKLEATLIDLVNHIRPDQLANAVSGRGAAEGVYTAADLEVALSAPELVTDEPILIIKIDRKWTEMVAGGRDPGTLPREEIYRAIRGDWVLSLRRARAASCALAVAQGLVRAVVVPKDWEETGHENRKRMTGDAGPGAFESFVGKSVARLGATGSQNPVRYFNC